MLAECTHTNVSCLDQVVLTKLDQTTCSPCSVLVFDMYMWFVCLLMVGPCVGQGGGGGGGGG